MVDKLLGAFIDNRINGSESRAYRIGKYFELDIRSCILNDNFGKFVSQPLNVLKNAANCVNYKISSNVLRNYGTKLTTICSYYFNHPYHNAN